MAKQAKQKQETEAKKRMVESMQQSANKERPAGGEKRLTAEL